MCKPWKNKFVTENVLSIVVGTPTRSIDNHMKHIDISRTTKCRLCSRGNVKRNKLIDDVVDINWSSETKRIKQYSKVNYDLMIQIQN